MYVNLQCAYTYLLRHPDDKMMRSNLDFFKSIPAVTDEMFVSREEPQHQKYYKAASAAYDNKPPDFQATKDNILLAIQEYYKLVAIVFPSFAVFSVFSESSRIYCRGRKNAANNYSLPLQSISLKFRRHRFYHRYQIFAKTFSLR